MRNSQPKSAGVLNADLQNEQVTVTTFRELIG